MSNHNKVVSVEDILPLMIAVRDSIPTTHQAYAIVRACTESVRCSAPEAIAFHYERMLQNLVGVADKTSDWWIRVSGLLSGDIEVEGVPLFEARNYPMQICTELNGLDNGPVPIIIVSNHATTTNNQN